MFDVPTLSELEEEHWSIVVLAHRLTETLAQAPGSGEVAALIDQLEQRCTRHLLRHRGNGGVAACHRDLCRLLGELRPLDDRGGDGLVNTMAAFESALIATLQHDRAAFTAMRGLPVATK